MGMVYTYIIYTIIYVYYTVLCCLCLYLYTHSNRIRIYTILHKYICILYCTMLSMFISIHTFKPCIYIYILYDYIYIYIYVYITGNMVNKNICLWDLHIYIYISTQWDTFTYIYIYCVNTNVWQYYQCSRQTFGTMNNIYTVYMWYAHPRPSRIYSLSYSCTIFTSAI